jgi:hypothetical protein
MNKKPNISAGKFLSQSLRALASEPHEDDGSIIKTRAQCLAEHIWDAALGYKAKVYDKETRGFIEKEFGPQTWAINLIFDRIEGKVPISEDNVLEGTSVASRVEEISKDRINDLT